MALFSFHTLFKIGGATFLTNLQLRTFVRHLSEKMMFDPFYVVIWDGMRFWWKCGKTGGRRVGEWYGEMRDAIDAGGVVAGGVVRQVNGLMAH